MENPNNGKETAKNIAHPQPQRLTPHQNRFETLIRLFGDDAEGRDVAREIALSLFAPDEAQMGKVIIALMRWHINRLTITAAPDHEDAPPPPPPPPPRKQDRPRPQDWEALYKPLEGEKGGLDKW